MQNLNTLFNLVKQAAPVTSDPYTQDSTSTLNYNNPLGPGFWQPKNPISSDLIEGLFKKYNNPLGPGFWMPRGDKYNPADPIFGPFAIPSDKLNPWNPFKDPFAPMEDKKNPWERNKDLDKYYDEFWKWYNKDGLWTYKPGSNPSWEDETWRKHKKEFIDYYNNQNQPVAQPTAQPATLPAPSPQPAAQPAPQPAPQQSSTHIVGPVIGKTTYNPAGIIR